MSNDVGLVHFVLPKKYKVHDLSETDTAFPFVKLHVMWNTAKCSSFICCIHVELVDGTTH